jgi:hypothetical protein
VWCHHPVLCVGFVFPDFFIEMGNGSGIQAPQYRLSSSSNPTYHTKEYYQLEKCGKIDYFYQNPSEYLSALSLAIERNALDCLELLIISGNIRQAYPVHLCCRIGRLEPLELLLSAGIPGGGGDVFDSKGLTALHNAALSDNRFGELSLIVSLLCLSFPESLKVYDRSKDGFLPIHTAIVKDNLVVLEAMVAAVGSLRDSQLSSNSSKPRKSSAYKKEEKEKEKFFDIFSYLTANGKNLFQIAKENKSILCENYLYSLVKDQKKVKLASDSSKKSSTFSSPGGSSAVSQERIMKIWEKFFENAFKNAGITEDDLDDDDNEDIDPYSYSGLSKSNYKDEICQKKKSNHPITREDKDAFYHNEPEISYFPSSSSKKQSALAPIYPYSVGSDEEEEEEEEEETITYSDVVVDDWFDWIVCYDSEFAQEYGTSSSSSSSTSYDYYYVMNSKTKERQWLNEYYANLINRQQQHHVTLSSSKQKKTKRSTIGRKTQKKEGREKIDYLFVYEDSSSITEWSFPTCLEECVSYGWLTYYDSYENYCYWINIVSYIIEVYLPLGMKGGEEISRKKRNDGKRENKDERKKVHEQDNSQEGSEENLLLTKYGLSLSIDYPLWCEASQICCYSWIMVICSKSNACQEEPSSTSSCYYLNSFTTHTQWDPPNNWEYLINVLWNGWILCCVEEKQEESFW